MSFYDSICPKCERYKWDHSPICSEWIPPWERKEEEWSPRMYDAFNQLKAEVVGWREKHAKVLLEIDKLKAKVERGSKQYKY